MILVSGGLCRYARVFVGFAFVLSSACFTMLYRRFFSYNRKQHQSQSLVLLFNILLYRREKRSD